MRLLTAGLLVQIQPEELKYGESPKATCRACYVLSVRNRTERREIFEFSQFFGKYLIVNVQSVQKMPLFTVMGDSGILLFSQFNQFLL